MGKGARGRGGKEERGRERGVKDKAMGLVGKTGEGKERRGGEGKKER